MYTRLNDETCGDNRVIRTRAHTGPLFRVLRSNCASYDKSIEYHGAIGWNALPPTRRNAETLVIFKQQSKIELAARIPLVVE